MKRIQCLKALFCLLLLPTPFLQACTAYTDKGGSEPSTRAENNSQDGSERDLGGADQEQERDQDSEQSPNNTEPDSVIDENNAQLPPETPESPFVGRFACAFTSESFAGDQSSGEDTAQIFVRGVEVEGGFALHGEGRTSPFASCEAVFDTQGDEAVLRDPQPCQDGIIQYTQGAATVTSEGFTAEVAGQGPGSWISMGLVCRAEEGISAEEGADFLGPWHCNGQAFDDLEGGPRPMTFGLINQEEPGQRFRTFFEYGDLVRTLASCQLLWGADTATMASVHPEASCYGGPFEIVRVESSLILLDGMMVGIIQMGVEVSDDFQLIEDLHFRCTQH